MTQVDLQHAARRQPFEPFRLILSTGAAYDIRHPDLIMVGQRAAIIGLVNQPDATAFERILKIDLLHVVGIEEIPKTPPPKNGAGSS